MLIKCPECELQVSDKAISCPHCGYPIDKQAININKKKSTKHKKLPNGFGQISKISNKNLRNPYRAMTTVGKDRNGKPICKVLKPKGYFKTYNEAYEALMEFNKNPYDLSDDLTFSQLYDKWSAEYFKTLKSKSSIRTVTAAWAYCSSLYDMPVREIRARHLKGCIEDGTVEYKGEVRAASSNTKGRIKSLFNIMFDYAVEYELTDKNYARTFELSNDVIEDLDSTKRSHMAFTDEEFEILKNNIDTPIVDIMVVQCYMGWRPQELGLLRIEKVNLDKNFIVGGMKTESGIERSVPIHPFIKPVIERYYKQALELGSEYLFNCTDTHTHRSSLFLSYEKYQKRFQKAITALNLNPEHKPHDPRKHFVTMAKKYNLDEYAIKRIVGHKIDDVTEAVYTERKVEWLYSEICKIG